VAIWKLLGFIFRVNSFHTPKVRGVACRNEEGNKLFRSQ